MKSAFTHWAKWEAARDEHHRGPLEIRQFSRILCNVDFLEWQMWHFEFEQESTDSRAMESSHLLFKQPVARLNADPILHCLRCLHDLYILQDGLLILKNQEPSSCCIWAEIGHQ